MSSLEVYFLVYLYYQKFNLLLDSFSNAWTIEVNCTLSNFVFLGDIRISKANCRLSSSLS